MLATLLLTGGILAAANLLHYGLNRRPRAQSAANGLPSPRTLRLHGLLDLFVAILLLGGHRISPALPLGAGRIWPADVGPALLQGSLGGLFMHLIGGGSPLPLAALLRAPGPGAAGSEQPALPAGLLVLGGGESASELIWRAVALTSLARVLSLPLALLISAGSYGLRRAACGEDHAALAALDGVLLGVLYRLSGSLVAVIVAHLLADLLAYTTASDGAEALAGG